MLLYKDILSVMEPLYFALDEKWKREKDGVQACCKKSQLKLSCCCCHRRSRFFVHKRISNKVSESTISMF